MKAIYKRILLGTAVIISSMIMASLMTFVFDWCVKNIGHELRFEIIFGIGGSLIGFAYFILAICIYTNNMGDGFREK